MIEDKTKEPQTAEPAQQPPKKRGQKLRSLWAQFQCMQLLRRHRFRRRTQHHVNHFSQKLLQNRLVLIVGEALYALGFSAEYAFVRVGRTVCRGVSGALLWGRSLLHTIVSMAFPGAAQIVRDLFGPIVLFFRGMGSLLVHAHRVRKEKGFGAAVKDSVHYLVGGVRRNVRTLPRMAMYILPVLALAGMVTVVQNTIRQPYALEVQVNGQTVGYVANEDVFNSAKEAVQERINYAGTDENTKWTVEPTYTISVAHRVLDENEMANAILKSSSDQISEGTALYLDGELTAVCSDGTALQSYLSSLLEPYENPEDPNVTVGFNKEVTLENGIYFNESFQQENDVESMLSGVQQQEKIYTVQTGDTLWSIAQKNDLTFRELCELNTNFKGAALTETSNIQAGDELIVTKQEATLEVRITKIETWQEEIPYASETTKSNEYNVGTKKTTQAGENGIRSVTAQRVYDTNGTQLSQQILSTEVIKEPVTEKIVVGTKKQAKTSYITGSGQFIWPVPGYRNCSRWYGGSRHRHQGRLQQGWCRYGLWLLHHHQPWQRLHHRVCTLPVAGGPCRPDRQAGPADRPCGQHRTLQRQPLPLRDPPQRLLHCPAERVQPQQIQVTWQRGLFPKGKGPSAINRKKGEMILCLPLTSAPKRAISPRPSSCPVTLCAPSSLPTPSCRMCVR